MAASSKTDPVPAIKAWTKAIMLMCIEMGEDPECNLQQNPAMMATAALEAAIFLRQITGYPEPDEDLLEFMRWVHRHAAAGGSPDDSNWAFEAPQNGHL